jgi:hypothetical protein
MLYIYIYIYMSKIKTEDFIMLQDGRFLNIQQLAANFFLTLMSFIKEEEKSIFTIYHGERKYFCVKTEKFKHFRLHVFISFSISPFFILKSTLSPFKDCTVGRSEEKRENLM